MMSGHGANPIFFNKKRLHCTSRTLVTPYPSHPPQSGRHMCITPNIYPKQKFRDEIVSPKSIYENPSIPIDFKMFCLS